MLIRTLEGVAPSQSCLSSNRECSLQRLFSTFPDGWPGWGLLLVRAGLGIALIYLSVPILFTETQEPVSLAQNLIEVVSGILFLAGLWTPLIGALAAVNEIWVAFSFQFPSQDGKWVCTFLAVLSAGLAMVGPGALSIDARLFGRRRLHVDLPPDRGLS
jgi:uncharacterized membrane protein YphA (DoxX/SURF4 family)